jgi:hypothetical protein
MALVCLMPGPARASGLLGGANTVQAFYYNGVLADPEGEIAVGAGSSNPASLAAAVNYQEGAADVSTIAINNTTISITNLAAGFPFCVSNTPGSACADAIDGFDFLFTGEDILGVSVDPASASDFRPVSTAFQGNTHLGLQLISPNEIRVDVTGDEPGLDDKLTIDVSFTAPPPPPPGAPEPATFLLLGGALGLGLVIRRVRAHRPS